MLLVHQVEVRVYTLEPGAGTDVGYATVTDADVALWSEQDGRRHALTWDASREVYGISGLPRGGYKLVSARPALLSERSRLSLGSLKQRTTVLLRPLVLPTVLAHLIGVYASEAGAVDDTIGPDALDEVLAIGGTVVATSGRRALVSFPSALPPGDDSLLEPLRSSSFIAAAGRLVWKSGPHYAFETGHVLVTFGPGVTLRGARWILASAGGKQHHTRSPRTIAAQPLAAGDPPTLLATSLRGFAGVRRAEAELVGPDVSHAPPNAPLWEACFDRKLLGCETAYDTLAAFDPAMEWGDPALVVAVLDEGVATRGGAMTHPDFAGKTTDLADFVANATNLDKATQHGTRVAGVAVGAGTGSGTAGVAPGVALQAARIQGLAVADAVASLYWSIGHGKPSSMPSSIPATLTGSPADVIVSSLTVSTVARTDEEDEALAYVARIGRDGRGTVFVLASGNGNSTVDKDCPWAASPWTLGVGASIYASGNEDQASYSSGGPELDFVAPSSQSATTPPTRTTASGRQTRKARARSPARTWSPTAPPAPC